MLGFGSGNGKIFQNTILDGEGAEGKVTGAYATRGRQHLDFDTTQEHAAANCNSDLAFRGILNGRSSAVWRGMIKVDPAPSRQTPSRSRATCCSQEGSRRRDPGPGDPRQRRALHARRRDRPDRPRPALLPACARAGQDVASRLVVEGFLAELVERFEEGPMRDALATALERRLADVLA